MMADIDSHCDDLSVSAWGWLGSDGITRNAMWRKSGRIGPRS